MQAYIVCINVIHSFEMPKENSNWKPTAGQWNHCDMQD